MDLPQKSAYLFLAIRKLNKFNSVNVLAVIIQSTNEKNIANTNQKFLAENLGIDRKTVYNAIEDLVEKDLIQRKYINDDLYFELSGSIKKAVEAAGKVPMTLVNKEYQNLKKDYSYLYVNKKKEKEKSWDEQLKEAKEKLEYRKKRKAEYDRQQLENENENENFWNRETEIEEPDKEIEEPKTVPSILANSKAAKEIKTLLGKSNV